MALCWTARCTRNDMADELRLLVYVEPEGERNRCRGKRTRYDRYRETVGSSDDDGVAMSVPMICPTSRRRPSAVRLRVAIGRAKVAYGESHFVAVRIGLGIGLARTGTRIS